MTPVTLGWTPFLLFFLILTGCSLPAALNIPAPGETKLFEQGLDQFISSGELTILKKLPGEYPQGKWHKTATDIVAMAEKEKALFEEKDKALDLCIMERDSLTQENKILETTLNQLKEVLINTELQSK